MVSKQLERDDLNKLRLVFVICAHRRVVEGSGIGIVLHWCVVHVNVHGKVVLWQMGLSCMQKLWSA